MLTLLDIKDWLKTLDLGAEHFYIGKLANKQEKSIGTYKSKQSLEPYVALGGLKSTSYHEKAITFLIHWSKDQDVTERAALCLYNKLEAKTDLYINGIHILYIKLLDSDPIDVGTDDSGVYEMVVNAVFYYERKEN